MPLTRREFLSFLTTTTVATGLMKPAKLFAKEPEDYDQNLSVFFADVHINGDTIGQKHQIEKFEAWVAEILKMNPLPARAFIFGDLAWLFGRPADYATSYPYIKQMEDAGIKVTIGMGNHDKRGPFLAQYPQYEKTTKIPGQIVSVVPLPGADFIMLDSLQEGKDKANPVGGMLSKEQQDWLAESLPKWERPFFLGAHHAGRELKIGTQGLNNFLFSCPKHAGFIHGHEHRWIQTWTRIDYKHTKIHRTLGLPSTGHWGDIGYVLFRELPDRFVATCVQKDFYFPSPRKPEARPAVWDAIAQEHNGQYCTFMKP